MNDTVVAAEPRSLHRKTLNDTPLKKFFDAAVKYKASDLIMRSGLQPKLRLKGALKSMDVVPPTEEEMITWVREGLTDEHFRHLMKDQGSADLACGFDVNGEIHRFRLNIFRTRERTAIAARRVSNEILNFEQLCLPPSMEKICLVPDGLVLLCGVTGSGKSTTIAAMLDYVNINKAVHILTIEDPVEYLFTDKKAIINQREVGLDVPDFKFALRALVRENPDVVLIGEMRDRETFEAALHAAETGHLVFGTIHASSATQAFNRIYDLFPHEEREAIRAMLAYQMQAFVYQKLLPTLREDMPRVPAVEILLQAPIVRKLILEGREGELSTIMRDNREMGMQTFTDSLVDLCERGYIHPRVAQSVANSPEEIKMRLKGITTK